MTDEKLEHLKKLNNERQARHLAKLKSTGRVRRYVVVRPEYGEFIKTVVGLINDDILTIDDIEHILTNKAKAI